MELVGNVLQSKIACCQHFGAGETEGKGSEIQIGHYIIGTNVCVITGISGLGISGFKSIVCLSATLLTGSAVLLCSTKDIIDNCTFASMGHVGW